MRNFMPFQTNACSIKVTCLQGLIAKNMGQSPLESDAVYGKITRFLFVVKTASYLQVSNAGMENSGYVVQPGGDNSLVQYDMNVQRPVRKFPPRALDVA